MGDRGRQLAHRRDTVGVRELQLRLGQIGFAAAQPVFGLLGFIDINRQAVPLDDASLPIAQRLTTSMVPPKLGADGSHPGTKFRSELLDRKPLQFLESRPGARMPPNHHA